MDQLGGALLILNYGRPVHARIPRGRGFSNETEPTAPPPTGNTLFTNNQISVAMVTNNTVAQTIATRDDLVFDNNQVDILSTLNKLPVNTMLAGATLRANSNRLKEPIRSNEGDDAGIFSLLTFSSKLNTVALNQVDHCIVAWRFEGKDPHVLNLTTLPSEREGQHYCKGVFGELALSVFPTRYTALFLLASRWFGYDT
jgi:hypothetical protein